MTAIAVVRLVLAMCLGMAAGAKAASGVRRFAGTLRRYHVLPEGTERAAAVAVIALEAAATGLLASPWYRSGAVVVAALAAGFAYFVSTALARGDRFVCGCFGRATRDVAVSPWLLAGDVALLGAALFLVLESGMDADRASWLRLLFLVGAALVLGGILQAGRVAFFSGFPAGLESGTPVPEIVVPTAAGTPVSMRELARDGGVILFVSVECPSCIRLLRALPDLDRRGRSLLVVASCEERTGALVEQFRCDPRWTTEGAAAMELRRRLRIPGVPAAVAVGGGRVLGTAFPAGRAAVEEAIARAARATDDGTRASVARTAVTRTRPTGGRA